jgi:hypothetical protein
MAKQKKADSAPSQRERFVETARALGCDEDKERFDEKLGKIAGHKAKSSPKERPKGESHCLPDLLV